MQSFLSDENSTSLSRAAAVVIQEILSMYSDILTLLHSVVQLNTIFCFNLLQDQEALDRIVQLYLLRVPSAGTVLFMIFKSEYVFSFKTQAANYKREPFIH